MRYILAFFLLLSAAIYAFTPIDDGLLSHGEFYTTQKLIGQKKWVIEDYTLTWSDLVKVETFENATFSVMVTYDKAPNATLWRSREVVSF